MKLTLGGPINGQIRFYRMLARFDNFSVCDGETKTEKSGQKRPSQHALARLGVFLVNI